MNWKNFKTQIHESWHKKLRPFIESNECDAIYKFLKAESKRGVKIAPLSSAVWRCFMETPYDDLKVVMMGLSPYHTFKEGIPIADGLLMGCSITNYPQPSLNQFYSAIEVELHDGLNLNFIKNPDVSYLAKQGVLMFNASLTVEMNKAGNHLSVWEPFVKYLFEEVLSGVNVPIILLGKEAGRYDRFIAPFTNVFKISHPASASYSKTEWDSQGVFKTINKILKEVNGDKINWLEIKN